MGMSPERSRDMLITQRNVEKEAEVFSKYNPEDTTLQSIFEFLIRKVTNKSLRSYLSRKSFDYLAGEEIEHDQLFLRQLPFIADVIMTSQYYDNHILDEKAGINTLEKAKLHLLKNNLLRTTLYDYIDQEIINPTTRRKIGRTTRSIFKYVDIGQFLEKTCNTSELYFSNAELNHPFTEAIEKIIPEGCIEQCRLITLGKQAINKKKHSFLNTYFQRLFLISSTLFKEKAKLIADLIQTLKREEIEELLEFIDFYGIMLQLVNDILDFVPSDRNFDTVGKIREDAFSDLMNRNMTLPMMIHVEICPGGRMAHFLKNENIKLTDELKHGIFDELVSSKSIFTSMEIGCLIAKKAYECLNQNNPQTPFFKDMCAIAQDNKFYWEFFEHAGATKPYKVAC